MTNKLLTYMKRPFLHGHRHTNLYNKSLEKQAHEQVFTRKHEQSNHIYTIQTFMQNEMNERLQKSWAFLPRKEEEYGRSYWENVDEHTFFKKTTANLRGPNLKFYHRQVRLDVIKFFFSERILENWNRLLEKTVSTSSLSTFKKKLDNWMGRHRQ